MERKRSKGVTFWAVIFIVCGICDALLRIHEFSQGDKFTYINVIGFTIDIFFAICGFYLLQFKETARKAVIYLGLVTIILVVLSSGFKLKYGYEIANKKYEGTQAAYLMKEKQVNEYNGPDKQKLQQNLKIYKDAREFGKNYLPIVILIFPVLAILIVMLIPIYFFSRPKVKEQFI